MTRAGQCRGAPNFHHRIVGLFGGLAGALINASR
jgi:hypothetical protein